MGRKKTASPPVPVGTTYTDYSYTEVDNNTTMTSVISTMNTNFSQYNTPPLTTIETRLGELDADLKPIAKSGLASDATQDTTHRFVTDTQIANWDEIAQTKIVYDHAAGDKVYRSVPGSTAEDITRDFLYGACDYPYMSELDNDGPPAGEPGAGNPYLTMRDVFAISNLTASTYEENTEGDDYEYFTYSALVDLSNHLYNGENVNNCIYYHEFEEIENYTAIVCFNQASADLLSINKITRTDFDNGKAYVKFNTTFNDKTVSINSILFIHKDRNQLGDAYTAADFLESNGSPYMKTGISSSWTGQLGMIFTSFNGTGTNAILGNGDYFGIKYDNTNSVWNWVYHYNGTDYVDTTTTVAASTYYHIIIIHEGTNKKVFVNGNNLITAPVGTDDTGEIYLFANNSSGAANFATAKLYAIKIFADDSGGLLKGDYVPCSDVTSPYAAHFYNLVDKEVLDKEGSGTIVAGDDPDISDYIILGKKAPTVITRGHVNQFYRVQGTNDYYQCFGYSTTGGYIWNYSLLGLTYTDL